MLPVFQTIIALFSMVEKRGKAGRVTDSFVSVVNWHRSVRANGRVHVTQFFQPSKTKHAISTYLCTMMMPRRDSLSERIVGVVSSTITTHPLIVTICHWEKVLFLRSRCETKQRRCWRKMHLRLLLI